MFWKPRKNKSKPVNNTLSSVKVLTELDIDYLTTINWDNPIELSIEGTNSTDDFLEHVWMKIFILNPSIIRIKMQNNPNITSKGYDMLFGLIKLRSTLCFIDMDSHLPNGGKIYTGMQTNYIPNYILDIKYKA